jgi:hypothetical protein
MKKLALFAFGVSCMFGVLVVAQEHGKSDEHNPGAGEPEIRGIHWARDAQPLRQTSNPNMTYHGGKIMPTVNSTAIFWGTSWRADDPKIAGLDSFYTGHGQASNYAQTVNEYTGTNGQVGSILTHNFHIIDNSPATGGSRSSVILGEVCKAVTALDPTGNGYYPVYTDVPRGHAGYCAWHSYGTCSGVPVQFAFFFKLDNDPGCDPQDTQTGNPQGLAALANVSAHEISEARSDPASPGAWYDSSGAENGDKCAWTFNVPFVTFPNGTKWKVQGEWSNAAYQNGTGYPNASGQKGCVDGH